MILKCTECGTSFNFEDSLLKEGGSKVRCSQCQSVFVAYPPGEDQAMGGADGENQSDLLGDLDLEGMEGLLDLDDEPDEEEPEGGSADETDFELDLSDDDEDSSGFEMDETEALDLADMDDLFDLDGESSGEEAGAGISEGGDNELDFSLDEDSDAISLDGAGDTEVKETMELELDDMENLLDLDEQNDNEDAGGEVSGEGDFDFDFSLDDDSSEGADDGDEMKETMELDLDDMESMIDLDETGQADQAESGDVGLSDMDSDFDLDFQEEDTAEDSGSDFDPEDLDITMDLNLGDTEKIDDPLEEDVESTDEITLDGIEDLIIDEDEAVDEISLDDDFSGEPGESDALTDDDPFSAEEDMTISLDTGDDLLEDDDGMDELESTDELDLSGLEDDFLVEDSAGQGDASGLETAEDDFSLDLDLEEDQGVEPTLAVDDQDISELDISDVDDVMEIEDDVEAVNELDIEPVTDDSGDDLGLDLNLSDDQDSGMDGVEELDFSEVNDISEADPAGEFDLDLDLTSEDLVEEPAQGTALDDTGEFALSDLETMIEGDGEAAAPGDDTELDTAEASELDLVVDFNDSLESEAGDDLSEPEDVELEFAVDDDSSLDFDDIEAVEEEPMAEEVDEFEDTFDMGTLGEDSEDVDVEDIEEVYDVEDSGVVVTKKRSFIKSFAVFLILVGGGGFAVHKYYWNDIKPMVANIPYVGGFLKPEVKDDGNLNIAIIERTVDGVYVENTKSGTLFVIKGQIKNNYDHPRNFITITGRIIAKDRTKFKTKTVYAGNVLNEADLARLDETTINKRLRNRFGDNRSNMRIQKGKTIPFMIVFSQLPSDLDEMTVQVASSAKTRT